MTQRAATCLGVGFPSSEEVNVSGILNDDKCTAKNKSDHTRGITAVGVESKPAEADSGDEADTEPSDAAGATSDAEAVDDDGDSVMSDTTSVAVLRTPKKRNPRLPLQRSPYPLRSRRSDPSQTTRSLSSATQPRSASEPAPVPAPVPVAQKKPYMRAVRQPTEQLEESDEVNTSGDESMVSDW